VIIKLPIAIPISPPLPDTLIGLSCPDPVNVFDQWEGNISDQTLSGVGVLAGVHVHSDAPGMGRPDCAIGDAPEGVGTSAVNVVAVCHEYSIQHLKSRYDLGMHPRGGVSAHPYPLVSNWLYLPRVPPILKTPGVVSTGSHNT